MSGGTLIACKSRIGSCLRYELLGMTVTMYLGASRLEQILELCHGDSDVSGRLSIFIVWIIMSGSRYTVVKSLISRRSPATDLLSTGAFALQTAFESGKMALSSGEDVHIVDSSRSWVWIVDTGMIAGAAGMKEVLPRTGLRAVCNLITHLETGVPIIQIHCRSV